MYPILPVASALLLASQDPSPSTRPAESAPASRPTLRALGDAEAKEAVARFEQASKTKQDLGQKMQALEDLTQGAHPRIARAIDAMMKRETLAAVRLAGARALGDQPPKETRMIIVAALKERKNADQSQVLEALVHSLGRTGYEPADVDLLENFFQRGDASLQKAVIQCFGKHAEKSAMRLLLENLDEPRPVDVNSGDNPPAEYWEKRWKAWKVWVADVREAIRKITGQDFQDSTQARKWLKQNGARVGVKRW